MEGFLGSQDGDEVDQCIHENASQEQIDKVSSIILESLDFKNMFIEAAPNSDDDSISNAFLSIIMD